MSYLYQDSHKVLKDLITAIEWQICEVPLDTGLSWWRKLRIELTCVHAENGLHLEKSVLVGLHRP